MMQQKYWCMLGACGSQPLGRVTRVALQKYGSRHGRRDSMQRKLKDIEGCCGKVLGPDIRGNPRLEALGEGV